MTKAITDFYSGKARCKECIRTLAREAWAGATPEQKQAHVKSQLIFQKTDAGKLDQRKKRLKHRYGITLDQYNWLLEEQDHKCFLCGEDERVPHHASGELMKLAVDHDHRCCPGTKKGCGKCVRGLLCYNCNRFMGRVDRSPRLAARFRDYQDRRPLQDPELEEEVRKQFTEYIAFSENQIDLAGRAYL